MEPPNNNNSNNNNNNARFGRFGAAAADPMISSSSAAASGPPPPAPAHRGSHRRAQSETFLRLPDDLLFDVDADFGIDDIDFPSLSDDAAAACGGGGNTMSVDSFRSNGGGGGEREAKRQASGTGHFRSLSVDAAFFEDLDLGGGGGGGGAGGGGPTTAGEKRFHHRRTSSMDGSSSSEFETSVAGADFTKKTMAADKLAELALIDPKRAKRILANRQSAARSKERKIRYTGELERKVQKLQTEATTLSAQLTLLQRDTNGLTVENKELKLRLQAMEQQAHLRDALNEALREEVQRLKIATGQIQSMANNSFNRGPPQQSMYHHPQTMHHIGVHPSQQLNMSQSSSSNGQSFSSPSPQDSMDFM